MSGWRHNKQLEHRGAVMEIDASQPVALHWCQLRRNWRLKTIFAPFEAVVETPMYGFTIFNRHFGKLTLKAYTRGERRLRLEPPRPQQPRTSLRPSSRAVCQDRGFAFIKFASLAIALCFPLVANADDPCDDAKAQIPQLLVDNPAFGTKVIDLGEVRSIARIRHDSGDAILLQWAYGAAGRVQCTYVAYRHKGETYRYFEVDNNWGYANIVDIDRDGLDEVTMLQGQPWGMECSGSMAALPHRIRITHLDMASRSEERRVGKECA